MYSQCPECLTRFRVTAAALRAAHGTVRCGRCGSAFDALPRLSDTLQDAEAAANTVQPLEQGTERNGPAAAATGLLGGAHNEVTEFQFSADDIENVFIDVRDWQDRFGTSNSPGDRAGELGDTSNAELDELLENQAGGTHEEEEDSASMSDSADPTVWVHEPESVEDITLEGERIEIDGFAGFEEDFLEREIEKEIEEQLRAEATGSQRSLARLDDSAGPVIDAVPLPDVEPLHDLDSTDRFEILRIAPESAPEPNDDSAAGSVEDSIEDSVEVSVDDAIDEPAAAAAVPAMPAAVAAAAAGLASDGAAAAGPVTPAAPRAAAPWRRFPDPVVDDEAATEHEHDPQLADDLAAVASARRSNWAWGVGAFLLALLLSAQLVHHFRVQLARDPSIGPSLREVYDRIGRPLPPNWNLAAFELRQWGANEAAPTAAGAMTVRASIRNGAAYAQPMPLLRLELEDRFGTTVARRDFAPREYLRDPAQAGRLLEPNAATEAELAVVDAATEAVGYRLDVCWREEGGLVRCADTGETTAARSSPAAP